ncbi:hypothetical protein TRICI_001971 [Trichomonascus ciferrii]|uniref:Protein YTP1-like C-terminal domain-containing protein n=1 Tax=Trichomonascus ciferrii TaxID=44093 RepID=A0A642V7S6_9ASCO|nr:hypothetical protein TRICI_001971 [Trichomonascus ciferrii]
MRRTLFLLTLAAPALVALADEHPHHHEEEGEMVASMKNMSDIEPSPKSMHGGHHHGMSIKDDPNLEPQQKLYWQQYNTTSFLSADAPNKGFLYTHVALTLLGWIVVYPVALMLSTNKNNNKAGLFLPVQTLHSAMVLISLLALAIYGATAPRDLYPNNAYSKMSVALFFVVILHWVCAVGRALAHWALRASAGSPLDGADYVLARHSQDSGLGSISSSNNNGSSHRRNSSSFANHNGPYLDDDDAEVDEDDGMLTLGEDEDVERLSPQSSTTLVATKYQDRLISRIMQWKHMPMLVSKFGVAADTIFSLINRPLFVFGFAYLLTGAATMHRMAMGNKVFNILAHFIKGGVFFLFGLLTLSRYLGCFADQGMAWNIRPGSELDPDSDPEKEKYRFQRGEPRGLPRNPLQRWVLDKLNFPSMEFVESLLIFIYGTTNVFLERLANEDGVWHHKDLQHASIAFMFIGGGLCGLILESSAIRRLLAGVVSSDNDTTTTGAEDQDLAQRIRNRMTINPFPAFIVFWTGVLMSQHEQEFELATSIHMQWGYLFSVGALFRLGTYALLYLSPPQTTKPSRPFTELITSFCLICGGMVFIQSNIQTVQGMMYRGLDSMFTLNVNVGICALLMAWEMVVISFKAWAGKRGL